MEQSTKWELVPAHFGPLWSFVEDDEITDIDFNGTDLWITNTENERIKVEEHGVTKEFIEKFSHYIANNVSKPFNKVENLLEADTDTLRISIVHESSAISGRSVCIRKTLPTVRMTRESMIKDGYCSKEILELLTNCVKARMNFVFCGEPGVGKTEGIKFFSQYIPANESHNGERCIRNGMPLFMYKNGLEYIEICFSFLVRFSLKKESSLSSKCEINSFTWR